MIDNQLDGRLCREQSARNCYLSFLLHRINKLLLITGSSLISHNTLKEWDMRYFQINQNRISLLESGHSSMATDGNI